jgi:transposase
MPSRYDASTKAKAIRLVREHRADYPTEYAAITAVAGRLGMTPETLRLWIRQDEVDSGKAAEPGVGQVDGAELRAAEVNALEPGATKIGAKEVSHATTLTSGADDPPRT